MSSNPNMPWVHGSMVSVSPERLSVFPVGLFPCWWDVLIPHRPILSHFRECVWIQEPLAGGSSCLWQEEFPWFLTEQEELIGGSRASSREFREGGGCVLSTSGTAGAGSLPSPGAGVCIHRVLEGGSRAGPPLCPAAAYLQALPWCCRALLYLQELAEELMPACQPPAPAKGVPEPEHVRRKRRGRRRKGEDTDSDDPAQDADFVPSQEVLQAEEEEEGSDTLLSEASEPELEAPRGHGTRMAATGVRAGALPGGLLACVPAPTLSHSVPAARAGQLGRAGTWGSSRWGLEQGQGEEARPVVPLEQGEVEAGPEGVL